MGSSALSVQIRQAKNGTEQFVIRLFYAQLAMAPPPSRSQAVLPAQNLVLDKIERLDDRFRVDVHVQQVARCPECGKVSRSRHRTYLRWLKDLPWQGCAVELRLKVPRLRCRNPAFARKIFAEPIPKVARSHARWTTRVGRIIRLIGYTRGETAWQPYSGPIGCPNQRRSSDPDGEGF
jgi:hypothetical protein